MCKLSIFYFLVYILIFLVKMGFCVAVNCGNNSFRKQNNSGVSFFRLPKDDKLKKEWLINIRKENQKPPFADVLHNRHS